MEKCSFWTQKFCVLPNATFPIFFFDFIFSRKSSEAVSGGPNAKFGQNTPSVQYKNTNFSQIDPLSQRQIDVTGNSFLNIFHTKGPAGHPCPAGVI